jgi:hypothetical protein
MWCGVCVCVKKKKHGVATTCSHTNTSRRERDMHDTLARALGTRHPCSREGPIVKNGDDGLP